MNGHGNLRGNRGLRGSLVLDLRGRGCRGLGCRWILGGRRLRSLDRLRLGYLLVLNGLRELELGKLNIPGLGGSGCDKVRRETREPFFPGRLRGGAIGKTEA